MTARQAALVKGMGEMWGAVSSLHSSHHLAFELIYSQYVGDRVERQSLKFFYLEDCINGNDCFIPTNYSKIIDRISALPLAKANIQFQSVMQFVEFKTDMHQVGVTTCDGKQQFFDDVVITTPLGWLKKNQDCIHGLSPRIRSALDAMSFGRLEKVYCVVTEFHPRADHRPGSN